MDEGDSLVREFGQIRVIVFGALLTICCRRDCWLELIECTFDSIVISFVSGEFALEEYVTDNKVQFFQCP